MLSLVLLAFSIIMVIEFEAVARSLAAEGWWSGSESEAGHESGERK